MVVVVRQKRNQGFAINSVAQFDIRFTSELIENHLRAFVMTMLKTTNGQLESNENCLWTSKSFHFSEILMVSVKISYLHGRTLFLSEAFVTLRPRPWVSHDPHCFFCQVN